MKKISLILFLSLLFFSFFAIPVNAGLVPCGLSEDDPDQPGDQTVACDLCDFFVMLDNIVDFLLTRLVPVLAAIMIAIGGFMYIISRANPDQLTKVRSLLTAVAIGLLIVYGAWLIISTFLAVIGAASWEGFGEGWWIINCP